MHVAVVVGWVVGLARWWLIGNNGFMGLGFVCVCVGLLAWALCVGMSLLGGFAWCVWRWHYDLVVIDCLRGRGRKRGRGREKEIVKNKNKMEYLNKMAKNRVWDIGCVVKWYNIIDKVTLKIVK